MPCGITEKEAKIGARKWWLPAIKVIALSLCAVLTVAPALNIVWLITTTGADNLCNDYLQYVGLIDRILSGNYNWLNYISDTFYKTHSVALPVLLHLINAACFHWNVYLELYAGIILALLRLVFLYFTLSVNLTGWRKAALCPVLSLLIFSNSQMSVFAYGDGALAIELSLTGLALGIWAISCLKSQVATAVAMAAGGLIASYSWGNGLVTWLIFLAALILMNYRKPAFYIVWLSGFLLSIYPYLQSLVIAPLAHSTAPREGTAVISLFNLRFLVNTLGWPLCNNIADHREGLAAARTVAWAGIVLFFSGLLLIWRSRERNILLQAIPAFLLIAHGLLSIWQISVFRILIAPWYTAVAMTFWQGLAALALLVGEIGRKQADVNNRAGLSTAGNADNLPLTPAGRTVYRFINPANLMLLWSFATISFIVVAYLKTNLTYDDKTLLFFSRSPASASALRHYKDGPTYGEPYVFQWGAGNPGLLALLAGPLEKHNLSVFSAHQRWDLQGDFLLDTVKLNCPGKAPAVIWTAGQTERQRLPWWHYRHLNLLLPTPDTVSWTISLPESTGQAFFRSAVAIGPAVPLKDKRQPITFAVHVKRDGFPQQPAFSLTARPGNRTWHQFTVPLAKYRGTTITLSLSCRSLSQSSNIPVVLQFPHIDLNVSEQSCPSASRSSVQVKPSNTDLCAVQKTSNDFVFNLKDLSCRQFNNISINLSRYSHLMFAACESCRVTPRAVTISLYINHSSIPVKVQIPLLADAGSHSYCYDLKLMELAPGSKLTGLQMEFANTSASLNGDKIAVSDLRLIRSQ